MFFPRKLTDTLNTESLAAQFLKMSIQNSQKNIETCGLLFGMLIDKTYELTHVLLPKQKGTHDSCVTTNEEQILEFQGKILL